MIAVAIICGVAALIIATGALVKHLAFVEEMDAKLKQIERNRLSIKYLNENFSKRVYEVLEELAIVENKEK